MGPREGSSDVPRVAGRSYRCEAPEDGHRRHGCARRGEREQSAGAVADAGKEPAPEARDEDYEPPKQGDIVLADDEGAIGGGGHLPLEVVRKMRPGRARSDRVLLEHLSPALRKVPRGRPRTVDVPKTRKEVEGKHLSET